MKNFTRPFLSKTKSVKLFLLAMLLCGISSESFAQSTTYTPGSYSTTVPSGVTTMQVTVTGAAGGTYGAGTGGKGGSVIATYAVTPGTIYYIYVGSKGSNTGGGSGGSSYAGGEDGGSGGSGPATGGGGGAASDIRNTSGVLGSRIVVGGGGGSGMGGGCGGTAIGGNGGNPATAGGGGGSGCSYPTGGSPGTQSGGGPKGGNIGNQTAGSLGQGGIGGYSVGPPTSTSGGSGAGGGGYYGGGGAYNGGGGGGSSYASPTNLIGSATFNNGVNTGDGEVIICFGAAAITGPNTVCPGGTIALSDATPSGTWSSSNPGAATISNSGVVYGVANGTTIISYSTGSCPAVVTVTVSGLASITGPATACAGSTITLNNTASGGTWSSSNSTVATISSGGVVSGSSSGTTAISYTVGSCAVGYVVTVSGAVSTITGPTTLCVGTTIALSNATSGGVWSTSNSTVATLSGNVIVYGTTAGSTTVSYTAGACATSVTITVSGTLTPVTGPNTVCAGATITLSNATTGGTWSSSNSTVATINSGGVVSGSSSGTTAISYTNGTCSAGFVVTVGPLPAISGNTTLCPGSTTALSNAVTGGVWSSDNTPVATVSSTGVVSGVASGTANISYITGPCSVSVAVTVGALPAITGPTTVCPNGTITLNNATTGGTWSSSNTTYATVNPTTGVVTGVAAGTVNISYTSGGCSVGYPITVGPLPAITGTTTLCAGSVTALSNTTPGGAWSSSSVGVATVDAASGAVSGVMGGTATITYTVGSCTATIGITVNGSLTVITGPATVCSGATIALSNATSGGVWSSDNSTVATVSGIGVVSGATAGTVNISYTVGLCATGVAITVNTLPPITGPTSVCAGSTITLNNATPGGAWSSGSPGAATVSSIGVVSGVASGSSTIIYTVGSCTSSVLVTVGTAVAAIGGPATVCSGASITLNDATTGGAWSSDNAAVATVASSGAVGGVSPGTATISYTVGACAATTVITVIAGNAGTITGKDTVCTGGNTITLSDNVPGGTWTSSNTARATVDPVTGVVKGLVSSSTPVTITYTVINSCGTFTATHIVYVRPASQCPTGVNPVAETVTELKIVPNPNNGAFSVNLSSEVNEAVHIVVTNIVGEKVKEYITVTNRTTDIKLDPAAGIYLITATTEQGRYIGKVIVYK